MSDIFNPIGHYFVGGEVCYDSYSGWCYVDDEPELEPDMQVSGELLPIDDWAAMPFTKKEAERRLADLVIGAAPEYVERHLKQVQSYGRLDREALNRAYMNLDYSRYFPVEVLNDYGTPEEWGMVGKALVLMEESIPIPENDISIPDVLLDKGEGELSFEVHGHLLPGTLEGRYRWVRVTKQLNNGKPRIIATIFLRDKYREGFSGKWARNMWIARARKGMPPNPLDSVSGQYLELDGVPQKVPWPETYIADTLGTQRVKGQQPTLEVRMIPDEKQGNHWWRFPGFSVQSSDLIDVLFKYRDQGEQHIPVKTLKRAIELNKRKG